MPCLRFNFLTFGLAASSPGLPHTWPLCNLCFAVIWERRGVTYSISSRNWRRPVSEQCGYFGSIFLLLISSESFRKDVLHHDFISGALLQPHTLPHASRLFLHYYPLNIRNHCNFFLSRYLLPRVDEGLIIRGRNFGGR